MAMRQRAMIPTSFDLPHPRASEGIFTRPFTEGQVVVMITEMLSGLLVKVR